MVKFKCRGIRASWNSEMMEEALVLLREGHSQREVEQRTGIPRRTLRNHLNNGKTSRELGRKPLLTAEQEHILEGRIIRLANIGLPLTPKTLRRSVNTFITTNGINFPQRKKGKEMVGKCWYAAFLRRHPRITKRRAQFMNPARSQKLNKFIVRDYFQKLKSVLEKYDLKHAPDKIFNLDEKGCRLTLHHQQSVLALKGSKRVHLVSQEHGENVTIVACVNALGNAIPPMILFKGVRQKPTFSDNLPNGSAVLMSQKGSMTTELFCKWIDHFSKYKPLGKVLLIFDGAACHLDVTIAEKAEENDIELLCLPSNTTHELQPLDKSVFRSFEHHWDDQLLKYWDQNPDRRLTKERFAHVFTPVWEMSMTVANITSGFRATGIYPYNADAIPEEAFAPSTISKRVFEESDEDEEMPLAELRRKMLIKNDQSEAGPSGFQQIKDNITKNKEERSPRKQSGTQKNKENSPQNDQEKSLAKTSQCSKSFQQILKTPDLKKPVAVRRKAFNYKSQHITKGLFQKKNKEKSKIDQTPEGNESWYCVLCQESRKIAMRSCSDCHQWVHEECIGMTSDDEDEFVCSSCK